MIPFERMPPGARMQQQGGIIARLDYIVRVFGAPDQDDREYWRWCVKYIDHGNVVAYAVIYGLRGVARDASMPWRVDGSYGSTPHAIREIYEERLWDAEIEPDSAVPERTRRKGYRLLIL